jgi:hypothetical protein
LFCGRIVSKTIRTVADAEGETDGKGSVVFVLYANNIFGSHPLKEIFE